MLSYVMSYFRFKHLLAFIKYEYSVYKCQSFRDVFAQYNTYILHQYTQSLQPIQSLLYILVHLTCKSVDCGRNPTQTQWENTQTVHQRGICTQNTAESSWLQKVTEIQSYFKHTQLSDIFIKVSCSHVTIALNKSSGNSNYCNTSGIVYSTGNN